MAGHEDGRMFDPIIEDVERRLGQATDMEEYFEILSDEIPLFEEIFSPEEILTESGPGSFAFFVESTVAELLERRKTAGLSNNVSDLWNPDFYAKTSIPDPEMRLIVGRGVVSGFVTAGLIEQATVNMIGNMSSN